MDLWFILVSLVIAIAAGLLYNSWRASVRQKKHKVEILTQMVKKVEGSFRDQFSKKNGEGIKGKLHGKFTMFLRGNPYRIDGGGEAMKWYDQAMTELQTMSVHNESVSLLSEDVALVTFTFSGKGTRAEKPFESTGKTTRIWVFDKFKGWLLIHEHTSYNS